jgi:ABC-2 type transport system ATP-binding protein
VRPREHHCLGKLVESGSLTDLRHLTRTMIEADVISSPNGFVSLPGVHEPRVEGTHVRCQVDTDQLDSILPALTGLGVRTLTCRPPTLEELFLRHYEVKR